MLYNDEIKTLFRACSWPGGMQAEVVEYPTYLVLRLFRGNFNKLNNPEQIKAMVQVGDFIQSVRSAGVDCYLEVTDA